MKLTRLAFGLVLGLAAVGCGSDDNNCGDAGLCPDSAVSSPDGGVGDGGGPDTPPVGMITSGNYKATAAVITDDGCKVDPMALVTMMTAIPVDVTGGVMKVGNDKGSPAMPSLGSGTYGGYTFTLKRMNHVKLDAPSTCEYDSEVTSTITNDAINSFGLGVVEKQMNRKTCVEPVGVLESCASTWSWRMVKAQ